MLRAEGVDAPAHTHRVAVLLRRTAASTSVIALVLLALVATALGSGRDVIADYQDGQINACYTERDFRDALRVLRADEKLYGNAIEVVQEARATNTIGPDGTCEGASPPPAPVADEGSGPGAAFWVGLVGVLGLVIVGAGVWARRGGSGDDPDGPGAPRPGA